MFDIFWWTTEAEGSVVVNLAAIDTTRAVCMLSAWLQTENSKSHAAVGFVFGSCNNIQKLQEIYVCRVQ